MTIRSLLLRVSIVGLACATGMAACGDDDDPVVNNNAANNNTTNNNTNNNNTVGNIVEVATANGNFTTLLALATQTMLDTALAETATLTVFAPTDAAFTNLGVNTASVSDDVLANILLYHVVAADIPSNVVASSTTVTTLANLDLTTDGSGTPILVGGSTLSGTVDVMASNGRIHVMDEVIVPPSIVEVAVATSTLSTLVAALTEADLVGAVDPDTLADEDPITVFAPRNGAFVAAGVDLNNPPANLADILTYHVVPGQTLAGDLTDGMMLTTAEGSTIEVDITDGVVTLIDEMNNVIPVVATDIRTRTGVVHLIDGVLMPN